MESKSLHLQELTTYGYCSLQHKLRFVAGFPWFPRSYTAAVSIVVRSSLSEWFRSQMLAASAKQAEIRAYESFKHGLAKAQAYFKPTMALANKHDTDFILGVFQVTKAFDAKRDKIVGFDVPAEVPVQVKDKVINVVGTVDVVYRYMAGTVGEHLVLGSAQSVDDPLEDLVNYGSLRRGFATLMLRQAAFFDRTKPVRLFSIPILRGRVKPRWEFDRVSPADVANFQALTSGIAHGIESGVAIPTGQPARCEHCPYKTVCSGSLVTADAAALASAREVVEREGRLNPWRSK